MTTHEYLLNKYGATLTYQEASQVTGIHWQRVRNMCLRGEIKAVKGGRHWIITAKALADYLDGITATETMSMTKISRGYKKIV